MIIEKNALNMDKYLLYIHIPFCDSKCHYCSFNSYVDKFELKAAYMSALHKQLLHDLKHYNIKLGSIETIFIGGGTPTTVDFNLYEPIFETVAPYLQKNAEITSEANPNSTSTEWLKGMKGLGVNRISLGVQSFFNDKLKLLGRSHKSKDAVLAVERAYSAGFKRLSIDLIYATLLDTPKRIESELEQALNLPIDHLSAYELTIEEGTPFESRPEVRKESIEQAQIIYEKISATGWQQYEISNFGKSFCHHNIGYWEYKQYLGIGSGAVGRIGNQRLYPHREIEQYIKEPFFKNIEELKSYEIIEEKVFLGLRSFVGINADILNSSMKERADILLKEGKLYKKDKQYFNTDYLLSDEIALFILG
ncbi:radical SAM family heme chaperone HemW [Hydrogenimonas thermophila]|uniref:Heme chaperone HemW n=1 Tax=Hydrogenimonas thermophila TaxID=223786 RepID=A0A1I5MNK7_9BACT|nr:radical SAM family heme chaperone HemW [Hydrogenimonas thermophila]SFP10546.1 oxygen-independent coproporphyrinogen-3 oxidase [Hydrogenimonas thermophila]